MAEQTFHVRRIQGVITAVVADDYHPVWDDVGDRVAELTGLPRERIFVESIECDRLPLGDTGVKIKFDLLVET